MSKFCKYLLFPLIGVIIFLSGCGSKPPSASYTDYSVVTDELTDNGTETDSKVIKVPFRVERQVKWIQVMINGVSTDVIFDPGCSGFQISQAELIQLETRGAISEDDVLGIQAATIADGSQVQTLVLNIGSVVVGNALSCDNVEVSVPESLAAPALMGNGVFDRAKKVTVNNETQTIDFELY